MTIQDYIEFAKAEHNRLYREQSAAEVLLKKRTQQIPNWNVVLKSGGYYDVQLGHTDWQEMHKWFKENVGEEHYTWTGSIFWFESKEIAAWAALKWS